jgi:predicted nuclease with RNAse H fold
LLQECDVHALLRRQSGLFYSPGVKANVLIVGLDAASDLRNFGYALGRYEAGRPVAIESFGLLAAGTSPDAMQDVLVSAIQCESPALLAIDAPLGWPQALGARLVRHSAGAEMPEAKEQLFQRRTDRALRERTGKGPLEVGADRIARAAHRALEVLNRLRAATGRAIPLAWTPTMHGTAVIEVYPAATLRSRGVREPGYKRPENVDARRRIAEALAGELPGLADAVAASDHAFDACLCLLAAKDFLDGTAVPPTVDETGCALKEGWIWVRRTNEPEGSVR